MHNRTATLFDVWLNNGTRINLWAYSEDDALNIARGFNMQPIGVGALEEHRALLRAQLP